MNNNDKFCNITFLYRIERPLEEVGRSRHHCKAGDFFSREIKYLKLQTGKEGVRFQATSNKAEAVSLETLKNEWLSTEEGSLGEYFHQMFTSYKEYLGREGVKNEKENIIEEIDSIFNYTQSHQETLCFKIKALLADYFPFLFTSPKKILDERLECLTAIKNKIEEEYQNVPTKAEIALEQEKNWLEESKKSHAQVIDRFNQHEKTLKEIKAMCERFEDLSLEGLEETEEKKMSALILSLQVLWNPTVKDPTLDKQEQEWLAQLKQKKLPLAYRRTIENALIRVSKLKPEMITRFEQSQQEKKAAVLKLENDVQAAKKNLS